MKGVRSITTARRFVCKYIRSDTQSMMSAISSQVFEMAWNSLASCPNSSPTSFLELALAERVDRLIAFRGGDVLPWTSTPSKRTREEPAEADFSRFPTGWAGSVSTSTTSISPMGLALVVEYAFRFLVGGCFGDLGSSLTAGSRTRRRPWKYVLVQVSRVDTSQK
jgi:hypothetical protein